MILLKGLFIKGYGFPCYSEDKVIISGIIYIYKKKKVK